MNTPKQSIEALVSKLPDDCSLEGVQYRLHVLTKVRQGLAAAETQGVVSQKTAEQQLSQWLIE